jgi:hypothetical protein
VSGQAIDPRLSAGMNLLGRTGAKTFRIGHSGEDDGPPFVWYAVATWPDDKADAAGGLDPTTAVLRLCERVIDGATCKHCERPAMFIPDIDTSPFDRLGCCIYAWDPELATFRRDCEADTPKAGAP